ncbi:MAG: type III pantothenate kinase [Tissierellia bacterium]|nr:type III pantothenate kinase [Tissierellia bacterium]
MLLVVDVGNTNIVFGIFNGEELVHDWRMNSDKSKSSDEYGMFFLEVLNHANIKPAEISDVIVSSVVPNIMYTLENTIFKYFNKQPLIVGAGIKTGLNIRYDNPKEVGADRIVNAVSVVQRYGGPAIIIDIGTAITFCVIDKHENYCGGMIVPGIGISSEALFTRTSKLPKVEILKPQEIVGKNTVSSMQSGLYYGFSSMIDGIVDHICQDLKLSSKDVHIIATGGFASLLVGDSRHDIIIERDLTLDGLRRIFELNR